MDAALAPPRVVTKRYFLAVAPQGTMQIVTIIINGATRDREMASYLLRRECRALNAGGSVICESS
jgi:hypothetical protein